MKKFRFILSGFILFVILGCEKNSGDNSGDGIIVPEGERYGEIITGGEYHLGPVDWEESSYTNAFGPYPEKIQQIEGKYLAGLELTHNGKGEICDACIKIETDRGKSLILRVITTGYTTPNSIDVSPAAYEILNSGEYPRYMSWYVVKCPDNGKNIYYQFKSQSNPWWTAVWVRNVSLPVLKVEAKSEMHTEWQTLTRESDGSYVDHSGFGTGSFSIRVTAIDGTLIEDTYSVYTPGDLLESGSQF